MNKSQHIGRIALLKYYLIFILIAVLTPVITELILSNSIDFIAAFKELFKINSIEKNEVMNCLITIVDTTICSLVSWRESRGTNYRQKKGEIYYQLYKCFIVVVYLFHQY